MTIDSKITTLKGNILDIVPKLELSTIQHARDIQKDRWTNENLRGKWFLTGDLPLYTYENEEVFLNILNNSNNLIFKNLDNAVLLIKSTRNYVIYDELVNEISNPETLRINMSDLRLKRYDKESSYLEIFTASKVEHRNHNYNILNSSERELAEKMYGIGEDFLRTMYMLYQAGIKTTRIVTLKPEYAREEIYCERAQGIARLSFLYGFFNNSSINIGNRDVEYDKRRIRGEVIKR